MTAARPERFEIPEAHYQALVPILRAFARNEEVHRLARAVALAEGFSLLLAECPDPRHATALLLSLATLVPKLRDSEVKVVRIAPPMELANLEGPGLTQFVFERLFAPDPEPRLVALDTTMVTRDDRAAWTWLFQRLNERRNHLREIGAPLVVLLPTSLAREFAAHAPDLWSIRSDTASLPEIVVETLLEIGDWARRPAPRGLDLPVLRTEMLEHLARATPHALRAAVSVFGQWAEEQVARGAQAEAAAFLHMHLLPTLRSAPLELRVELAGELARHLPDVLLPEQVEQVLRGEAIPACLHAGKLGAAAYLLARISDGYRFTGNLSRAEEVLQEAMRLAAGTSDLGLRASLQIRLGGISTAAGRLEEALGILAPNLKALDATPEPGLLAAELLHVAYWLTRGGAHKRAIRLLQSDALPRARKSADRWLEVSMWSLLGEAYARSGELKRAIEVWKKHALPLAEGDMRVRVLTGMAQALSSSGRASAALRLLRRDELIAQLLDTRLMPHAEPKMLTSLARAFVSAGAPDEARNLLSRAGLPSLVDTPGELPPRARADPELFATSQEASGSPLELSRERGSHVAG